MTNDSNDTDIQRQIEWFERKCRGEGCDVEMRDMSKRVYCNDCLDEHLAGRGL